MSDKILGLIVKLGTLQGFFSSLQFLFRPVIWPTISNAEAYITHNEVLAPSSSLACSRYSNVSCPEAEGARCSPTPLPKTASQRGPHNKYEMVRNGGDFIEQGRYNRFDWPLLHKEYSVSTGAIGCSHIFFCSSPAVNFTARLHFINEIQVTSIAMKVESRV